MKTLMFMAWMALCAFSVQGASMSETAARVAAGFYMAGNPILQQAGCSIRSVERFPRVGTNAFVFVFHLEPKGYLVLNSDDRLPRLVSFSAESNADLSDVPENAFRALLIRHVDRVGEDLKNPALPVAATAFVPLAVSELRGPFLETSWNQNNPYNKFCQTNPVGNEYYGFRASVGCVATAYSQIMNFHRWPLHGCGSHSYTDLAGSLTGAHAAGFSDSYDWAEMLPAYNASGQNPEAAEAAVAELMYELCVAVEANFGTNGTSASTSKLGRRLGENFFFESCELQNDQESLIPALEADLRAGLPCVVSTFNHAVVADGLLVDDGETTYHIRYGWGGKNDGWWSANSVPGGALEDGVTSLRPRLLAFSKTNSVLGATGEPLVFEWVLPKRREAEADKLSFYRLEKQPGSWQSDASEISAVINTGWSVVSAGRSGDAWFTGPNNEAALILDEVFVPDASTQLTFWQCARLHISQFSVDVSTNDGASYASLYTTPTSIYENVWSQQSVPLAEYAGKQVRVRFSLSESCVSYSGDWAGVRLDDLAVTSGDWLNWTTFSTNHPLISRRFSEVSTLWDDCDDFSVFEVTSTSSHKDWSLSTTSGVANCFYKQPGGYSNRKYHLTSYSTITPTASTRLVLRAKYRLSSDVFRVLVSTDRSSFTEIGSGVGTRDWSDIPIDLSAYAGQAVYIRLEYVVGGYYSDGGIWIDSISTQEMTNPELEGQPIHYTTLSNLPAGTHTLAAALTDTNALTHRRGPAFTLTVNSDMDNDGIPNDWETQYYGGATNAVASNLCANGINTILEAYIAGLNPTSPTNRFEVSSLYASSPVLRWNSVSGRVYTIYWTSNLLSNFQPLETNYTGSFTDTVHEAGTKSFYKIKVELYEK